MVGITLDKRQIRQSFANAAQSYDAMAALQRQVGRELIVKLAIPHEALVLDVGCGTGFFTQQLRDRALLKNILALDIAMPMLIKTRQRLGASTAPILDGSIDNCNLYIKSVAYEMPYPSNQNRCCTSTVPLLCADAEQLPFASHSLDGLVSNLALQWCLGLDDMFTDVSRVLRANGQFVFSTFGASALCELKAAWAAADDYPHVNDFCSSLEIKQYMQAAGFVDIQIESKIYQVKYNGVIELMRELKGIGAHNVSRQRNKFLTTKGQLQDLLAAYPVDKDGKITASYEIIYVQATA